jgi:TonB-dependent starch-binding outer membrane protein SusC
MKKNLLLTLILALGFNIQAWAQEKTITGRVTDESTQEGLPGVAVVLKGTTVGTSTDTQGNYSLSVPSDAGTLVFRFIGYKPKDVPINGRSTINVALSTNTTQLSEIVVTGQGVGIEKKRLSTTVDVITAEDLQKSPVVRLDQVLQSKLPSTQIQLNSGQPGTASIIRSRGVSSAQNSTTPVIYIDGVRADNLNTAASLGLGTGGAQSSALADIPVENIERIEFIKGGAATTLYGADAANGVIQIFTKKGTPGPGRITFETQLGSMKGTTDYLKFKETADYLFDPGLIQSYRIGLDGGSDIATYSFSGNMYHDDGFRPNNDQTRYNLRGTVSAKVNERLRYTGSVGFTRTSFGRDYNANTSAATFGNLETGGFGNLPELNDEEIKEVRETIDLIQNNVDITEFVNRFQTSHSFEYKPIDKITLSTVIGLDSRNSQQKEIYSNALDIAFGNTANAGDEGSINVSTRGFLGITGSANAQYKEDLGDFSFITTLGTQFFRNEDRQFSLSATNVTEGSQSVNNAAETLGQDFIQTITNYGFYGQENIGFKNRYFLEFGLRADGNSAFGEEIGLQYFPKVGVSYDISSEEYFQVIPANIISNLKIRANYGEAGNFPEPFSRDLLVSVNPYLGVTTYSFGQPGDKNLKPERTKTFEVGGDLGLLNNRLNLSFTYYNAKTVDAIFRSPFSPSTGLQVQPRNLGEIENKGFESALNALIVDGENFRLSYSASLNKNDNVVLSSGGAPEFSIGGFTFLGSFVKEGLPVGYFRGGKPSFDDQGNFIESQANAFLGSAQPDYFGNTSLSATFFQRLSFDINAAYQVGAQGINVDEVLRYFGGLQDDRIPEPALTQANFFQLAGVWVEDTDFFKVRNISLSYRVPERFYSSFFKNLEVGFNAINPLNYVASDFDPEITGAGARRQNAVTVGGFGFGTESAPRQFLGTLRVTF